MKLQRNQRIPWVFEDGTCAGPDKKIFPPLATMTVSLVFPHFITVWLDNPGLDASGQPTEDIQFIQQTYLTDEWFIPD